jgi:hypothetical protein
MAEQIGEAVYQSCGSGLWVAARAVHAPSPLTCVKQAWHMRSSHLGCAAHPQLVRNRNLEAQTSVTYATCNCGATSIPQVDLSEVSLVTSP